MDKLLDGIGAGITLPPYEITNYKNEHVMADDFKDTYQIVFKDANIKSMISTLDSVCSANVVPMRIGRKKVAIMSLIL